MECQCPQENSEDAATGWWMNSNSVQMGTFTVVGYLLYRFSQTLPALIRWPIRLFCSLTGLTALWSWVSRLVGTLRVIQSLYRWLRRVWRFFEGLSSKFKSTTGSSNKSERDRTRNGPNKSNLRLIVLGPDAGGRTSLTQTLLGYSKTSTPMGALLMNTESWTVIDGEEVAVIETPDLLGLSLGSSMRAREALRSLQLTSPGPHAFLLVIRAPAPGMGIDQDAGRAIRATLQLFGDEVAGHIIPVLTHADHLGRRHTVDELLDVDAGSLKKALSLCDQRPELVDNRPECPLEEQSAMRSQLIGRAMEMKTQRGHFVHELQRREDHIREELMAEMSSALAGKLGHI